MYTIQENVRIVISLLKEYNIKHIVISPGGTNIAISQAVQNDAFFHCYSVVDERSAMYFAIGLYLQLGVPIATSCTSAQATRNYIPGLTEAYYKRAPILAITTSKLERFQYQDYMQAPDQTSLPKDAVKKSFDIPPITDNNTRVQCIHSVKEAILELTHHGTGPVQLNLRIDDALNGIFKADSLPKISLLKRYNAWDSLEDINLSNKKILLVIGEHRPFTKEEIISIEKFCDSYNVAIYVNHLSNYSGKYSVNGNFIISCLSPEIIEKDLNPDIFITIGGQTGDYALFSMLSTKIKNAEHWRISEDGNTIDTYNKLTKIFQCPEIFFFNKINLNQATTVHSYYNNWVKKKELLNENIDIPFSNLYVAQQTHRLIPDNSIINFAILNSLRCWSFFDLKSNINCFSTVSAFGIDGCTSTLIGESITTNELCFLVTGDLAFFYDMNSLSIRHIKNNVRILLINNNGGAEFKIMTKNWKENIDIKRYISAEGHNGTANGWAQSCGFEYLSASNIEQFNSNLEKFIAKNEKPIVYEVFTTPDNEEKAISIFISENKQNSKKEKMKTIIKKLLKQ